ncbi:MAG: hypothetical protein FJ333_08995, partial [Sphingomonadales bacterium]|nr:hypothetical protein [Sphingomonadales bacterium]
MAFSDRPYPQQREEVELACEKVARFTAHTLGVTAVHPNKNPVEWPAPFGQNVHRPMANCLHVHFLDLLSQDEQKGQYEKLINRCMLHQCREGYCLSKNRRDRTTGRMICRFKFPMDLHGFKPNFDHPGTHISHMEQVPTKTQVGAEFNRSELKFLRNHPTLVHHVPELLLMWGANLEGRPVKSYKQVLRYLLKYMFKDEPNSAPFQSITRSVISNMANEEPVRRLFQKILMKTVGEHDLSKQECHHILNGFEFVEFSQKFVSVNVAGTARVRAPGDAADDEVATEDNWAKLYWKRETDQNFIAAVALHAEGRITWNPRATSLYTFVSQCNKKWQMQGEHKVPHITPNFNVIPKRSPDGKSRYAMFLRTTLLTHKAGMTIEEVCDAPVHQLEDMMHALVETEGCPHLVREEFYESLEGEAPPTDEGNVKPEEAQPTEDELHIEPEPMPEVHEQNEWMQQLKTLHHVEQPFYEDDADYDDLELLLEARNHDWQADRITLDLTEDGLNDMRTWLDEQKQTFTNFPDSQEEDGPSFANLNEKQRVAYHIIEQHIMKAQEVGLNHLPQLLLNISGGAGTGKTYWLNTVRELARQTIGSQFIRRAAPSDTAAFLIGGETLHSLLYLPIGNAQLQPLVGERLMELQRKFEPVGVLIIDEKSMIGQEVFWMISERLKEARPQHQDQPFGNLSVVLLGDWKQLPPVVDA